MDSIPESFPLQKIHNVAIIGFGISGVASAIHLKDAGLNVTVYERSAQAGGIWYASNYNTPKTPQAPNR